MSNNATKSLVHLRATGEIIKRAQERDLQLTEIEKQASALIPIVVKALVDNERIWEHQAEKVAEALSGANGHIACLELMKDVATHRNQSEINAIGSPEKTASATAPRSASIGGPVANFDETESGQRFRERILNAQPAS